MRYIHGSEAKNINFPIETPNIIKKKDNLVKRIPRNQEDTNHTGFKLIILIGITLSIMLFMCVKYIHLINKETLSSNEKQRLEQEYINIKNQNDNKEFNIKSNIKMDDIYNIAVNKLGMKYPNDNQRINYTSKESEYVYQCKNLKK